MEKRGISAIVATVLIILITVAAVAIVWVVVLPIISDNVEFDSVDVQLNIVSSGGYTVYDSSTKMLTVQVGRGSDDSVIDEVKIIIKLDDGNSISKVAAAPGPNQMITHEFRLSGDEVPVSVAVAPIVVSGVKSTEGAASKSIKFSGGSIAENTEVEVFDIDGVPTDGLISWWKFDGDFNDSVGGNDGTQGSGSSNADTSSGVLVLDGDGDYVEIGNDDSLDIAEELTISIWVNSDVQNVYRTDDNEFDISHSGDGEDDGVNKWIEMGLNGGLDNYLWIYGQATSCNASAFTDYHLVVNNNPEIVFNWCDIFGLDIGNSLVSSDFEWIRFIIPDSWLINGVNKFNFYEDGGDCGWWCSNWQIGFDSDSDSGKTAWSSNDDPSCQPSRSTDPLRQGGNCYNGEAMIYSVSSSVLNYGNSYGIDMSGNNLVKSFVGQRGVEAPLYSGWNQVVMTRNSTSQNIYVDGVLISSGISIEDIEFGNYDLLIGSSFNGSIDNAMIYNRALSEDEIAVIFDNQKGGKI